MENKKLAKEILEHVKIDQLMRKQVVAKKIKWNKKIDKNNTLWLRGVIKKCGWPTISMVGKKASDGAWLLAQHADHDLRFQKRVLKIIKKIYEDNNQEIKSENIPYLVDRTLVHENKLQIFGTQFRRKNEKKEFEPSPIKDRRSVNKRRRMYGLVSLEENKKRVNEEYKKWENGNKK